MVAHRRGHRTAIETAVHGILRERSVAMEGGVLSRDLAFHHRAAITRLVIEVGRPLGLDSGFGGRGMARFPPHPSTSRRPGFNGGSQGCVKVLQKVGGWPARRAPPQVLGIQELGGGGAAISRAAASAIPQRGSWPGPHQA